MPAGSIRNLVDLERAFNARFITSNKTTKELESLSQMRKLPNETLRQYSARYRQLFKEIPMIDESWAARSFKNGLESVSKILDELTMHPPHGMGEQMRIVERFCALEELYANRAAQGIPNPTSPLPIVTPQLLAPILTPQSQPKKHVNNIKE
ncbi:hypothetical protein RHMOL_Rhmol13G0168800 [Rhododendron molle]|uniref:Uncharacterized protein n=1 Tax=Rhododendron molle TaxID=49168 RepID=A0ACC0L843_RHOML|nr:hypothetical protein RHMOL_Rhmol13G0168800 [Rhododendron molle]